MKKSFQKSRGDKFLNGAMPTQSEEIITEQKVLRVGDDARNITIVNDVAIRSNVPTARSQACLI